MIWAQLSALLYVTRVFFCMLAKFWVNLDCCLLHRWLWLWAWTWEHIYVWKPPALELFVLTFQILTHFSTGTCQNWSSLTLQLLVMDNRHLVCPCRSVLLIWLLSPVIMGTGRTDEVKLLDPDLVRRLREHVGATNGNLNTSQMATLSFLYLYLSIFGSG